MPLIESGSTLEPMFSQMLRFTASMGICSAMMVSPLDKRRITGAVGDLDRSEGASNEVAGEAIKNSKFSFNCTLVLSRRLDCGSCRCSVDERRCSMYTQIRIHLDMTLL